MIAVVRCPNSVCGHASRLSVDPPGRVFRCPRCQSKLGGATVVENSRRRPFGPSQPPKAWRRVDAIVMSTRTEDPEFESRSAGDLDDWLDTLSNESSSAWGGETDASAHHSPPGSRAELRLGRYHIQGIVGEGRYARVYRGYDPILDRSVALKVPRPGRLSLDKVRERFLGEARALARLRHPRIAPVYESAETGANASSPWR